MSELPTDLDFDGWVTWVFDHPVAEHAWHWEADYARRDDTADPRVVVRYLTQLFEEPGILLPRFDHGQIAQGLWFLASPPCSNHMFALRDRRVPWPERGRGIRSILNLYRKLFGVHCTRFYSHLDWGPEPDDPLNGICYMWWDVTPLHSTSQDPDWQEANAVILAVLEQTLRIPHVACQEGALHGLGHFSCYYPAEVTRIINRFLRWNWRLPRELRAYARMARTGSVQ